MDDLNVGDRVRIMTKLYIRDRWGVVVEVRDKTYVFPYVVHLDPCNLRDHVHELAVDTERDIAFRRDELIKEA